ncbi:hypothetical protein U1Q18_013990 [Sarracenia purpurea var. burkii]
MNTSQNAATPQAPFTATGPFFSADLHHHRRPIEIYLFVVLSPSSRGILRTSSKGFHIIIKIFPSNQICFIINSPSILLFPPLRR